MDPQELLPEKVWPAPAKLNLMLRITGRKADGYHLLQTVFQFIDRCDYLRFRIHATGPISRKEGVESILPKADLVVRAAEALKQHTGTRQGADIWLDKQLPIGGGLGGGSSDAATTLVALNALWKTRLSVDDLAAIGLVLGADVPVFIRGFSAWGEGVGENLTRLDLPEPWYLVAVPSCHVSTAGVFNVSDLTRNSPPITIADFLAGSEQNDCLSVVSRNYPEVAKAMQQLGLFGKVRLTGTGGCVFTQFDTEAEARNALGQLPANLAGFVSRGQNRSPLLDAIDAK